MLVMGTYHYPCQVVISFVFSWPSGLGTGQGPIPKVVSAKAGHVERWCEILLFQTVRKGTFPRLRGNDLPNAGEWFLLRKVVSEAVKGKSPTMDSGFN